MHGRPPNRGFSLLELMVVIGISLVVAGMAIPHVLTAAQNFKLRSTASSVSGLIQKCRMQSVSGNRYFPVLSTASATYHYAFIGQEGDITGTSTPNFSSPDITQLPTGLVFDNFGAHPSDTTIANGLTAIPGTPVFNPRGLPCFLESSLCRVNPGKIYITYIRQDRSLSNTGWAAIAVTPAGRVQVFTWDGAHWQ